MSVRPNQPAVVVLAACVMIAATGDLGGPLPHGFRLVAPHLGRTLVDPDASSLATVVDALSVGGQLILEQSGDKDSYAQVWLREPSRYQIEVRAGGPKEHYQSLASSSSVVVDVLTTWMAGSEDWRRDLDWTNIGDWLS